MSDLISRSELIEEINELLKSPYANRQQFGAECRDAIEIVRDLCVKRQTTAYDIDKVVEELSQQIKRPCYEENCVNEDDCCENKAFIKAIEIVKQGGVYESEQKLKEMESDSNGTME